jgi:hypothetical protein
VCRVLSAGVCAARVHECESVRVRACALGFMCLSVLPLLLMKEEGVSPEANETANAQIA